MLTISLADYGVGNLHSLKKSLEKCGAKVEVVTDMKELLDAECIAFPGVGAFDKTMEKLTPYRDGIRDVLEEGKPCIGICIGTQIILEGSEEGTSAGIGFVKGRVIKIDAYQLPHMGWNVVETNDELFKDIDNRYFYFANSYRCAPTENGVAKGTTYYESTSFPTFFRKKNFVGTQFHPEKSSVSGLQFLRNFIAFAEECQ